MSGLTFGSGYVILELVFSSLFFMSACRELVGKLLLTLCGMEHIVVAVFSSIQF